MTFHLLKEHPAVAKKMELMHSEDPEKQGAEQRPKWESAPKE